MRDDLSGFSTTPPADPFATTAGERETARMVELHAQGKSAEAQQILDVINRRTGIPVPNPVQDRLDEVAAADPSVLERPADRGPPLPPVGATEPLEDRAVAAARSELEQVDGGRELLHEWRDDLPGNLAHAQAGVRWARQEMPNMGILLDLLHPEDQRIVEAELLRFFANANRRYRGFMGDGR